MAVHERSSGVPVECGSVLPAFRTAREKGPTLCFNDDGGCSPRPSPPSWRSAWPARRARHHRAPPPRRTGTRASHPCHAVDRRGRAGNALPEYPRPQLTRDAWQNLNGVWQFAGPTTGRGSRRSARRSASGSWCRTRSSRRCPASSGTRTGCGTAAPSPSRPPGRSAGQRLLLHFGAVDYDAKVWVNGTQVATHRGGYDGFDVDVTDALHGQRPAGADRLGRGPHRRHRPADRQAAPGRRPRHLLPRQLGHLADGLDGAGRRLPASTASTMTPGPRRPARSSSPADTVPAHGPDRRGGGRTTDGGMVGQVTGAADTELALPVPEPEAVVAGRPVPLRPRGDAARRRQDASTPVGSYFGMREIGTTKGADGKLRIALNGKILFNMSTLDQGFWPDGLNTAPTDAALKFDLRAAQAPRLQHGPQAHQGRAGPLVLLGRQARPDGLAGHARAEHRRRSRRRGAAQFEAELHEMVERAPELTSIVAWVPFNEGWGEWDQAETGRIADAVKAQDPTRLVNAHSGVNCCNSKGDSGRGRRDRPPPLPRPGVAGAGRATGWRSTASTAASA